MSWSKRIKSFEIGDRVCYAASFLRNTGQQTGDTAFLRGKITELKPFGDNTMAVIQWDGEEEPGKVLTCNLSKVTVRGIADE